ncbi:hypothetical protein CLOM_g4181, partial [Closterium sp. NIES-68]
AEGSKKVDKGEDRSAVGNCLVPLVSCDGDWWCRFADWREANGFRASAMIAVGRVHSS